MDKQIKLENFSKAEIIQAVRKMERYYIAKGLEKNIIDIIQETNRQEAFEVAQAKRKTAIDRMNDFFNWKKEMAKKYGDGKQFSLKDLTMIELERGAKLQKAWTDSEEERKKAEKKEDSYYG